MKRIEVENSCDCTVCVQVVKTQITDHTGTHEAPDEIGLSIEDEGGEHVAIFTSQQAAELMRVIGAARMQITASNKNNH